MESEFARRIKGPEHTTGAATTLERKNSGTHYTNLGASATGTFTLPSDAVKGDTFTFTRLAAQSLRIAPGSGRGIYALVGGTYAKQTDNKYVQIGTVGNTVELVCDENLDWVDVRGTTTVTVEA